MRSYSQQILFTSEVTESKNAQARDSPYMSPRLNHLYNRRNKSFQKPDEEHCSEIKDQIAHDQKSSISIVSNMSTTQPVIPSIFCYSCNQQAVPNIHTKHITNTNIKLLLLIETCKQLKPISNERLAHKKEVFSVPKSQIGPDQFADKLGHNATIALIKWKYSWLT